MKKTTWLIIGLSVCVVALSVALVIVITQKKAESTLSTELYDFPKLDLIPKPWLERSFSLSSNMAKTTSYCNEVFTKTQGLEKNVDFLVERTLSVPYKWYMLKRPLQTKSYETKEDKK